MNSEYQFTEIIVMYPWIASEECKQSSWHNNENNTLAAEDPKHLGGEKGFLK